MNHTSDGQLRPLPIRPRPAAGETTVSYLRRLARANHLRPNYLRRCLRDPHHGGIRLDWLATLAGRPVTSLEYALADAGHHQPQPVPATRRKRNANKAALLATIRADAYERGLSIRGIADRHGVHRRTVHQALESPMPRPRKRLPPRESRLDPFKGKIDEILRHDLGKPYRSRHTAKSIHDELAAQHEMFDISYSTVRNYVAHRRGIIRPRPGSTPSAEIPRTEASPASHQDPATRWTAAHDAVEREDLPRLRALLDAGHDIEDDNGHGWTLLHHAIDAEHRNHLQTGQPLHASLTAFLLACGADPQHRYNGSLPLEEAEKCGHWLAAEIIRSWIIPGQRPGAS